MGAWFFFGMGDDVGMSAEDTLAICMLVILAVAAATLLTILISMVRNAGKEDEIEKLMREDEEDSSDKKEERAPADEGEGREPWEKDSDWWQDDSERGSR